MIYDYSHAYAQHRAEDPIVVRDATGHFYTLGPVDNGLGWLITTPDKVLIHAASNTLAWRILMCARDAKRKPQEMERIE